MDNVRPIGPLPTSFAVVSLIGLIVSSLWLPTIIGRTWSFAFAVLFVILLCASLVSMTYAPPEPQLRVRRVK